ncbi:MAG: hypothetical protein ACQEXX_18035 [Bacillota bacterium]
MKKLTPQSFDKAKQFMKEKARKLERSIYEYEFEDGVYSDVLNELREYQNSDGGFGHGLEPDLRCKQSSALATTRALEILQLSPQMQRDEEQAKMIMKTLRFFEDTYNADRCGWEIIPKEADQSPRAIWWNYGAFADHWGNPNADIVSHFIDFQSMYEIDKLEDYVNYSIDYLVNRCDLKEMHELFCYLHLFEKLNEAQKLKIEDTLHVFLDNCVSIDLDNREGYGATPLSVLNSPSSRYYTKYADVIPAELDELIDQQSEDGSWAPNWTWYQFEEEWLIAKEEWKGIMTLNSIRTLRNFNRIES